MLLLFAPFAMSQANIELAGVDNKDLQNNIRLLLREVQAPIGRINEDKYSETLIRQVRKALQAFGYYDAVISIDKLTFLNTQDANGKNDRQISYQVNIALNNIALVERVVLINDLADIDQSAIPQQITNLIAQVQQLQGKPLDHKKYEDLKNRLKTFTLLYGYFDFNFVVHKLVVQPGKVRSEQGVKEPSKAIVHWIFYLGNRYTFGELDFIEQTRGQEIAKKVKPFNTGEYFEQSKVGDFSIDMQSTSYFTSAIARANAQNASNYSVPIEVILNPKPKDTFEYGVGVSTDTGPRFTIDWSRPWVNLDGHSLGARLYVSNPRKALQVNYRVPKANPLNDFLNYQIGYQQTTENQTQSDTFSMAVQRQWGATEDDGWDKIGFIKYEQEAFTQGLAERETTRLLLPGFTYTRTRKSGDVFVSWGDLQHITVEGGSKSLLSDIDFFKVIARTKWIRELGKHRIILRADAGAINTNNFDRVPSTQRFFAGGDQSIRGFGLNEISDFDRIVVDGESQIELNGGKYLAVASAEYAYPVANNWRVATFVDAGNASDNPISEAAVGFGLGVHWLSPIGTVRIYGARGISDIEKTFRIHLVIGPGL
jgi:translocation and assembly module TamA